MTRKEGAAGMAGILPLSEIQVSFSVTGGSLVQPLQ